FTKVKVCFLIISFPFYNTRLNNLKFFTSFLKLLDVFQHYGLKDKIRIYFARVYAWGPEAALVRPISLPEEEFEERTVELYGLAVKKGFNIALDFVPVLCDIFLDNHFMIAPDGKIFKCWDLIGNEEFMVGDIGKVSQRDNFHPEDDVFLPNYYEILGIDPTQYEKCKVCSFLPLCHGECRAKSFKLYGNLHTPYCTIEALKKRQELIRFWIKFKYKELLKSSGQDKHETSN
ncbi:MAG: SPASM domain-containing protein, partial [Thermoproteota archaeon]